MASDCWPARNVCLQGRILPSHLQTRILWTFNKLYIWSRTAGFVRPEDLKCQLFSVRDGTSWDTSLLRIYQLYLNHSYFMKHIQNSLPKVLIKMCFPLYSCSIFISCYCSVRSRCSIFPMKQFYMLEESTSFQVCSTEQLGETKKKERGDCHCVSVPSSNALLGLLFWEKPSSSLHM